MTKSQQREKQRDGEGEQAKIKIIKRREQTVEDRGEEKEVKGENPCGKGVKKVGEI